MNIVEQRKGTIDAVCFQRCGFIQTSQRRLEIEKRKPMLIRTSKILCNKKGPLSPRNNPVEFIFLDFFCHIM